MTHDKGKEPTAQTPSATQTPAPTKTTDELALYKKTVIDAVSTKVNEYIQNRELNLPHGYSVNNAIKAAWLVLQSTVDRDNRPAMQVCDRNSVANALLDMIIQGLNPIKKQCYFVVYGKSLICLRSYFGTMAVAQMVNPKIADFAYSVVYQDDKFTYGIINGKKMITLHEQDLANIEKSKIVASYCVISDNQGNVIKTDIMTFDEIKQSWMQSIAKPIDEKGEIKTGTTHSKFTADMALRTVINRACKAIINSSSDNALLLERINRSEDTADESIAQIEIEDSANKGEILEVGKDSSELLPLQGKDIAHQPKKRTPEF